MNRHKGTVVLMITADAREAECARDALREAAPDVTLRWAEDRAAAMRLLRHESAEEPGAGLIILDAVGEGIDTLMEIKADAVLKATPVIALTGSEADVAACYAAGANCCIIKQHGIEQHERVMRGIGRFWLGTVRLPAVGRG